MLDTVAMIVVVLVRRLLSSNLQQQMKYLNDLSDDLHNELLTIFLRIIIKKRLSQSLSISDCSDNILHYFRIGTFSAA